MHAVHKHPTEDHEPDLEISKVPALEGNTVKKSCVTTALLQLLCNCCDALGNAVKHTYSDAADGFTDCAAVCCPSLLSSHCIISVTLRSEPLPF